MYNNYGTSGQRKYDIKNFLKTYEQTELQEKIDALEVIVGRRA